LLAVTRTQIEAYLQALGQAWCEDETNRSLVHMRNRIRHELLPMLREYNPRIEHALAHIAANASAEERHWQAELARVLPQLLLPGKPVRGGGRSVATSPGSATIALEIARLQALDPGLRRRVLRAVAEQYGATLDFETTERLLNMTASMTSSTPPGRSAKRLDLPGGVRVERSARELQFARQPAEMQTGISSGKASVADSGNPSPAYELPVPGTVEAPAFRAHYMANFEIAETSGVSVEDQPAKLPPACVRAWQPGDRVQLVYSSGPKKVKEILERMGIRGVERVLWPVVVWQGRIVWMRGVKLEADIVLDGDRGASMAYPKMLTLQITETRF
jgi:tRNA(Ile)-lysidine synthase